MEAYIEEDAYDENVPFWDYVPEIEPCSFNYLDAEAEYLSLGIDVEDGLPDIE